MLVNKWSSFLKSHLICSVPRPNSMGTHFDKLGNMGSLLVDVISLAFE